MGLFDAKYRTRFSLREAAIFDDTVGLQRKMSLEPLTFGISETNVGKHVAAAFFRRSCVFFS